jgi:hypothetical protein
LFNDRRAACVEAGGLPPSVWIGTSSGSTPDGSARSAGKIHYPQQVLKKSSKGVPGQSPKHFLVCGFLSTSSSEEYWRRLFGGTPDVRARGPEFITVKRFLLTPVMGDARLAE